MLNKKPRLLLYDFNNLFYRSLHVNSELSYKGKFTGGLYGFVSQVCSTINEVNPFKVAVCTDSPPYLRTKMFPGYKQGRKKNLDEKKLRDIQSNKIACEDFLRLAKIPLVGVEGLEADDLFAILGKKYSFSYDVVVASNDSDLYQLLDHIVLYKGRKKGYYDSRKFFQEYPQMRRVKQWYMVSALAGSHNDVPKIQEGIGELTAIRLLNLGSFKSRFKVLEKKYEKEIQRNNSLCILPFPGSKAKVHLPRYSDRKEYNVRDMIRFLTNGFGIQYSSNVKDALERDFE